MIFFDIHAHQDPDKVLKGKMVNISSGFDRIYKHGFYSAGIHPWYIKSSSIEKDWSFLQKLCPSENILAVGECGLDRVCNTDWDLQQVWFKKQVLLANQFQKPLIIHSVKAFDEVLFILKQMQVQVPAIFHGFNKSQGLAEKIVNEGYYLSFGRHLISHQQAKDVFRQIPLDKLFLETDVAEVSIEDVYLAAAATRDLKVEELAKQIAKNIAKVFGEKFQ